MQNDNFISHLDELACFEREWNEIHENSYSKSPFTSFNYTKMWYKTFASPSDVRVYRIREGNETIGFVPLLLYRNRGVLELSNLINEHCLVSQPLIRAGREQDFKRSFLHHLLSAQKYWDVFKWKFSYSFSSLPGLFDNDQLKKIKNKWGKAIEPTYSIVLNKSYENYFKNDLSSNFRKNLRLSSNRLSKTGNYTFFHVQGDEANRYWPIFIKLEGSGWKGIKGTAIIKTDHSMRTYYSELVKLLAYSGDLHLYFLSVNGKIIAGSFGCSDAHVYQEIKSAYDEESREFSPSYQLRMYMISDIISSFPNLKRIHMFPWDYGYKHRFSNEHAEYIETIIYNTTIRGHIAYFLSQLKKIIRERYPETFQHVKRIMSLLQADRT